MRLSIQGWFFNIGSGRTAQTQGFSRLMEFTGRILTAHQAHGCCNAYEDSNHLVSYVVMFGGTYFRKFHNVPIQIAPRVMPANSRPIEKLSG
jgi:hypothetical protein